ncbi:macrophage mannose receptor 1-like [Amphiura filiformis]|uniref:macrophage mannose receptor 1-like n=1 Tax=Amphiura filiformis TaxID=82378 RepID=UPI003B215EF2
MYQFISSAFAQDCGGNWQKYKDFCYLASSKTKTWHDARKECAKEQADLMIVTDADQTEWLRQWLTTFGGQYWMGLHDISGEGNFEWVDGSTPTSNGFINWYPGEPNDSGGSEDCAEFWPSHNGQWNDDTCTKANDMRYVCQRSIDTTILCDHDNGWITFADKCYYFKDSWLKSWASAETWCAGQGANLVSVNTKEEQIFLNDLQIIFQQKYWIGFSDKYAPAAGQYEWSDGSSSTDFVNWAAGQPDNSNYNNGGNCARVLNTATNGEWSTEKCGNTNYFVCERDQGTCPVGWRIHQGQCYQLNANNRKTWTDAKHYCDVQGAYMVTIVSDAENQWVTSLLPELAGVGITDLYIGISDVVTDGKFQWSQGSSVSYTNWNPNMPKDTAGQDDCGNMYTGDASGRWDTVGCYQLQAFICEIQAGRPVSPVPPDFGSGRCETRWDLFGDYCYYISLNH